MIKVVGAVLFIIGGIVLGRSAERYYAQKIDFWRDVLSFFTFCKSEIDNYGADLDEIIKRERTRGGKYASMIADAIQYNQSNNPDAKVLCDFSAELREVGLNTQNDVFDTYEKVVEIRMEQAEDTYEKKGKTYFRLIPILAIGAVVLLW